jgi:hypothetical protein
VFGFVLKTVLAFICLDRLRYKLTFTIGAYQTSTLNHWGTILVDRNAVAATATCLYICIAVSMNAFIFKAVFALVFLDRLCHKVALSVGTRQTGWWLSMR